MEPENNLAPHVLIEWIDSAKFGKTLYTKEEALKNCKETTVNTVGYLLGESTNCYVLASEYDPQEKKFRDVTVIPRESVTSVTMLYERAPRKVSKKVKK